MLSCNRSDPMSSRGSSPGNSSTFCSLVETLHESVKDPSVLMEHQEGVVSARFESNISNDIISDDSLLTEELVDGDEEDDDFQKIYQNYCDVCRSYLRCKAMDDSVEKKFVRNKNCKHIKGAEIDNMDDTLVNRVVGILESFDNSLVNDVAIPVVLWFTTFVGCSTVTSKVACCLQLMDRMYPLRKSLQILISIFDECIPMRQTASSDTVDGLERRLQNLEEGIDAGTYPLFIKIITIIGCLPLLRRLGINDVLGSCNMLDLNIVKGGKRTDQMILDLSRNILTVIKHFVRGASDDQMSFSRFSSAISTLVQFEENRSFGVHSVPGKMDNTEFLSLLAVCQNKQRAIFRRFGAMGAPERQEFSFLFKNLDMLVARNMNFIGDSKRDSPFVIGITGIPGTGKTDLARLAALTAMEALGFIGLTSENIFEKNPGKWYDGYNPTLHHCIIIDEISQLKEKFGGQLNVESFSNMLALTSKQPMLTEQAVAQKKAQTHMKASVVILMSNHNDYNAGTYVEFAAFGRRFHIKIHIENVKEQFRSNNHSGIDPGKVPPGEINLVNMRVEKYTSGARFTPVTGEDDSSLLINATDFLDIIRERAIQHRLNVRREADILTQKVTFQKCIHGYYNTCKECGFNGMPKEITDLLGSTNPLAFQPLVTQPTMGSDIGGLVWFTAMNLQLLARKRSRGANPSSGWMILWQSLEIPRSVAATFVWGFLHVFFTMATWLLAYPILKYVASEARRQCEHSSRIVENYLRLPKNADEALVRIENRFLGKFVDVQVYRGLIRALEALILTALVVKTFQRITKPKNAYRKVGDDVKFPVPNFGNDPEGYNNYLLEQGRLPIDERNPAFSIPYEYCVEHKQRDATLVSQTMGQPHSKAQEKAIETLADFGRPVELNKIAKSVWASPEIYTPFGVSSCNGGPLMKILLDNLVLIKTGEIRTYATCVYSNYYVYASHAKIDSGEVKVYSNRGEGELSKWVEIYSCVLNECLVGKVNPELNIIYIPGIMPRRSLVPWMFKKSPTLPQVSYESKAIDLWEVEGKSVPHIDAGRSHMHSYTHHLGTFDGMIHIGTSNAYEGRCGTPLVIRVGVQHVFYGVCVAGVLGTPKSVFSPIDKETLEFAVKNIIGGPVVPTSGVDFDNILQQDDDNPRANITRNHHQHYQPIQGTQEFLAVDPRKQGSSLKSAVVIDRCKDDVFQVFPSMAHELVVPIFKHTRNAAGEYVSMEGHALKELSKNFPRGLEISMLDDVARHMVSIWAPKKQSKSMHVLDVDTVVRGTCTLPHINAVKKSSSVGRPFEGKKGDYLVKSPASDAPDGCIANDVIKKRVLHQIDTMKRGKRICAIWTAHWKDEPRKQKKVDERKIRMFSGGEFSLLIIMKSLFGMAVDAILTTPEEFETACGINCFSRKWAVFAKRHIPVDTTNVGVINSDFECYDKTLIALVLQYVFTVLIGLMREWYDDWSFELEEVAKGCMTEVIFPIYNIDGLFCGFAASNPSGQWLTLICNGIAQSILMRVCFIKTYRTRWANKEALEDFDKSVTLSTLGDDGSSTVVNRPEFNFFSLKHTYAEMGMIFTPASKEGIAVMYEPCGSNTIGKRSMLFTEGRCLCPLEMAAIGKMITTCLDNTIVSVKDKMKLSFEAAGVEFAMYGRKFFDDNILKLRLIANKHGYASKRLSEMTFDAIMLRFDAADLTPHVQTDVMEHVDMVRPNNEEF